MIGGPALGGLLVATLGPAVTYSIDFVTFAASLVALWVMRAVPPPSGADRPSSALHRRRACATRGAGRSCWARTSSTSTRCSSGCRWRSSRRSPRGSAAPSVGPALRRARLRRDAGDAHLGLDEARPPARAGGGARRRRRGAWRSSPSASRRRLRSRSSAWSLAGAADMVSGLFRMTIWNQTIPDHLRGRLAGIEMVSYMYRAAARQRSSRAPSPRSSASAPRSSRAASCASSARPLLALLLPDFLRYDGREGPARKRAEEEARLAGRDEAQRS